MSSERKVVGNPAKRPGMVDWYAPLELMQTGVRTLASTALGAMIDTRTILAGSATMEDCVFDYSKGDRDSLSFDYLADTGDGFDATEQGLHRVRAQRAAADDQIARQHRR